MLGGGTFVTQNKSLPGSYINLVSASNGVSVFGERGTGVLIVQSDYGTDEITKLSGIEYYTKARELFGESFEESDIAAFCSDFFRGGSTLYLAEIASDKAYAQCKYGKAKHWGSKGNTLKIKVGESVDYEGKFVVSTYLGTVCVGTQTVATAAELTDDEYIEYNKEAELEADAGVELSGGKSDGFDGAALAEALGKLESYSFNAVGLLSDDDGMKNLLTQWTKRLRDEVGLKFQCVIYDGNESVKADYEGCIRLKTKFDVYDYAGVAWVTGAVAGAEVNKSLTNTVYDGDFEPLDIDFYTQSELEQCIENGLFTLHRVGDDYRVLLDINSLTEVSEDKGEIFKDNQTVRICDRIATDVAEIFNQYYLGKVPNDEAGRSALKSDIAREHQKLADIRAIESFESDDITVARGEKKGSVIVTDCICIAGTMDKLYMTVRVE